MRKLKIRPSIILLIVLCVICNNFLLLFNYLMALLLHELAHLFVANRRGYKLKTFRIDMFGFEVELNEGIEDRDSFAINIAGPMMNLLLCVICMASYWLLPCSYEYLNMFCFSNLILAGFNMIPIYPLDGGKILKSIIKNNKAYKIVNVVIKSILSLIFFILFTISLYGTINWFYLLMVIFFLTPLAEKTPTFSLFKTNRERRFEKVVLIKVSENENLYSILKRIKKSHYTIFYLNMNKPTYVDEDMMINFATKYPLKTNIVDILKNC